MIRLVLKQLQRFLSFEHHFRFLINKTNKKYFGISSIKDAGITEVYLLIMLYIGLYLLYNANFILYIGGPMVTVTFYISIYRPLEIGLFSLNWLLVDEGKVENFRRSLVTFLINILEIGIFFTIASILYNPVQIDSNVWAILGKNLILLFTIQSMTGFDNVGLEFIQSAILWLLMVTIIAKVVGSIRRKEKPKQKRKKGAEKQGNP